MTCIVAVADKDGCTIGGDVCATDTEDYSYTVSGNTKVFNKGEIIIGCCNSFRIINILRYVFQPPKVKDFIFEYLVADFVPEIQKVLTAQKLDISSETLGLHILVGIRGEIYEIQPDFSVLIMPSWGSAIGSGALAARGSLHTTWKTDLSGSQRVLKALESAEANVSNVRGPFDLVIM